MRLLSTGLLLSLCGASACAFSDDGPDSADVQVSDGKEDASAQIAIRDGQTSTISFNAPAYAVELSIACPVSQDPDVVGTQFQVKSDALGVDDSTDYASLWSWSGAPTAGAATLEITGTSGSQNCKVSLRKVSGTCTASTSFRSPETGHTHYRVGSTSIAKGAFPASGNHWGAWAPWNTVYEKPIKRGFLLHNLEHGGIVLSYGCSSADDSAACKEAADNLVALKESFGEARVIVTPDPGQPTMYGVRAWRTGFSSDCFDDQRMQDFMNEHFRHGREDVDADPPIKFDPTTTNVPCVDIMAAPDSCS